MKIEKNMVDTMACMSATHTLVRVSVTALNRLSGSARGGGGR